MQTQWRAGASGPTGLDYVAVRLWIDETTDYAGEERRELWQCLQACEREVLDAIARRREREEQQRAAQQSAPQIPGL